MCLWGMLLADVMTEKDIISPRCSASLPSLKHFQQSHRAPLLAFAFLPQLFGPKNASWQAGAEGFMSSGSMINVTGTVQNEEEHILLDCPHEHLVSLRTWHQLIFSPKCNDGPTRMRIFLNLSEPRTRYVWCWIWVLDDVSLLVRCKSDNI